MPVQGERFPIIDINGKERKVFDVYINEEYPGFVEVLFRRHKEWYPIDTFKEKNPDYELKVKQPQYTNDGRKLDPK